MTVGEKAEIPTTIGTPGTPNKLFFIQSSSGDFSDELRVLDLSEITPSSFTALDDAFYKTVEQAAKDRQNDRAAWVFELTRGTFSSTLEIHDAADRGAVVAELDLSILKRLGVWKLSFPAASPHSSHDLEIRPVSIMKKQETFIKDDTLYMWDMAGRGKTGELFKTVENKRVQVAAYAAKSWFKNSVVLAMDTAQTDEVVVLGSCVAALNRNT